MTHWSPSYSDDKYITARHMIRAGCSTEDLIKPLGYTTSHGVLKYLRAVGLPLPFGKGNKGNRKPRSDAEKQAQAERMRAYFLSKNQERERHGHDDQQGTTQEDRHRFDPAHG